MISGYRGKAMKILCGSSNVRKHNNNLCKLPTEKLSMSTIEILKQTMVWQVTYMDIIYINVI